MLPGAWDYPAVGGSSCKAAASNSNVAVQSRELVAVYLQQVYDPPHRQCTGCCSAQSLRSDVRVCSEEVEQGAPQVQAHAWQAAEQAMIAGLELVARTSASTVSG